MNNSHNEALITKKVSDLYKSFYQISSLFPKRDRYSLGLRCDNYILDILELVISASSVSWQNKCALLIKASVKLDILKLLIRDLTELRTLNDNQYIFLQSLIQEIGKMLGGWIKFISTKNKNSP